MNTIFVKKKWESAQSVSNQTVYKKTANTICIFATSR